MDFTEQIERLTEAFYRVTDLLPDEEPVKWALRKKAIEIMERASRLERENYRNQTEDLQALSWLVPEIISLLKLAYGGTFISQANFEILAREYTAFLNLLNSTQKILPRNVSDSKSDAKKEMSETVSDTMSETMSDRGIVSEIIDFFKTKNSEWLTVKDLSNFFNGTNPRTVRRHIEKLVKDGVLISQGENRWRKYALNSRFLK